MLNRMRRTMNHGLGIRLVVTLFLMISPFTVNLGPHVLTVQPAVAAASADSLPQVSGSGAAPASGTTKVYLPVVMAMARPPAPPPTVFGMQMYEPLNSPQAALDLARSAQVSWVRWPLSWSGVEPRDTSPDQYHWSSVDPSLEAASATGLRVIATVDGNPFWAATYPGGHLDRSGLGPFVEFVGALAERYDGDGRDDAPGSPRVDYWEFYNEPDCGNEVAAQSGCGYWGQFGAEYAQMLCAVQPAIKAANPNAKIVLGGIALDFFLEDGGSFVRTFLDDVLQAGGGQCIDVMNFHYYPVFSWAAYGPGLIGKANYVRSKLAAYGLDNLEMVVTEAGWHSNDDPIFPSTPQYQADFVVKLFTQARAAGLSAMMWWTWSDLPNYWGANGLLTTDLLTKPAYFAYQAARNRLGFAAFRRSLTAAEVGSADVEVYLFETPGPVYVIWPTGLKAQQIKLPGRSARVTDTYDSNPVTVLDSNDGQADGFITVTASGHPAYVEVIE